MKKISIYAGPGSSQHCVSALVSELQSYRQIELLQPRALIDQSWCDQCEILIMPGGRDRPYCDALNGAGNRVIRNFVHAGGRYLGICAGAYYACARIVWDKGSEDQIIAPRELALFPGSAIGPAYGNGTFGYEHYQGAAVIDLHDDQAQIIKSYYHGGCMFEQPEADTRVLAYYSGLPGTPIAALAQPCGNGLAVLLGVHAEIGTHAIVPDMPAQLCSHIAAAEPLRRQFIKRIWSLVGIDEFKFDSSAL